MLLQRSPVAPTKSPGPAQVERGRDRRPVALRHDHHGMPRHRAADAAEKLEIEIGARAVLPVGLAVAAVEERPVTLAYVVALEALEADARLGDLAAFLADLLALVVAEGM